MAEVNITIIGLGRLGTSFGLAVKAMNGRPDQKHRFIVTGSDKDAAKVRAAGKLKAIDIEQPAIETAVSGADIVFLAVPYSETEAVLEIIGDALKPGAVVMDCAPLKQTSVLWAAEHFKRDADGDAQAYLVGVTPIINPEYLGLPEESPESGRADLFANGVMIISPAPNCPPDAVQLVSDLTDLLDVKVHYIDPAEHDGIAAAMEGLPLLVQLATFQSIHNSPAWDDAQWFGNPAFFLATYQLAGNDPAALGALLYHNRLNMTHKVDALIRELGRLREMLAVDDALLLGEQFQSAMEDYAQWQAARQRNRFGTEPDAGDQVRGGFSMFGAVLPSFALRKKTKK